MVCAGNLDWDAHSELLIRVLGRLFVLLDKVAAAGAQNRPVWLELGPDFELAMTLNEAERRVELQIGLEVFGEGQLNLHAVRRAIIQDNFLTVELFVDQDVEVVFFLFNVDRYINTAPCNRDWDRLRVVLVLKEEGELLVDLVQLVGHKRELNLSAGVSFDLCSSFELHLGKEFVLLLAFSTLNTHWTSLSVQSRYHMHRLRHLKV